MSICSSLLRIHHCYVLGKRWRTRGDTPVNDAVKTIVDNELQTIRAANEEPILITEVKLDTQASYIRLNEV